MRMSTETITTTSSISDGRRTPTSPALDTSNTGGGRPKPADVQIFTIRSGERGPGGYGPPSGTGQDKSQQRKSPQPGKWHEDVRGTRAGQQKSNGYDHQKKPQQQQQYQQHQQRQYYERPNTATRATSPIRVPPRDGGPERGEPAERLPRGVDFDDVQRAVEFTIEALALRTGGDAVPPPDVVTTKQVVSDPISPDDLLGGQDDEIHDRLVGYLQTVVGFSERKPQTPASLARKATAWVARHREDFSDLKREDRAREFIQRAVVASLLPSTDEQELARLYGDRTRMESIEVANSAATSMQDPYGNVGVGWWGVVGGVGLLAGIHLMRGSTHRATALATVAIVGAAALVGPSFVDKYFRRPRGGARGGSWF